MAKKRAPVWIWQQLMRLAIIVIGLLPILSSGSVASENRFIVLLLAGAILIVGAFGEIWKPRLAKKKKDIAAMVRLQILIHFLLLTLFLQFFSRINGPLFILYLPVIMEAFLTKNVFMGNAITLAMISITTFEYGWMFYQQEVAGLLSYIEFIARVLSLVFVRAYGLLLAKEMLVQEKAEAKTKKTSEELEATSQKLRRAYKKLKELSELKDEFISVASHELRTPMTKIKGYLSLILEGDAGRISAKTKEFLENAYESNDRMIRMVNNMLNVSQIQSGKLVVELKDIQPEEVIQKVVSEYQMEAQKHGLELSYKKPKEALPKVRVDPDQLREIIVNLVANAISFTAKGQIILRNKVENGMVITEVEDSGVGISKENQKELFKKFSQVEGAAETPLKEGSGLGLYICKMLLDEFGGEIWVKSKPGKGTTFYFDLPAINESG